MNERRIDRQRYWLACFFEDMPVGLQFKPGLLHLTIITWFVAEIGEAELLGSFQSRFKDSRVFSIRIGERAWFGPKKDVPVNLVEPNRAVTDLHQVGLDWFEQIGARWAVKNSHSGLDYVPHIRYREGSELVSGETLALSQLTLVKARRREDGLRTVAAGVELV